MPAILFTKENAAEMARRSHGPNSARNTAKPKPLPVLAPEIDAAEVQRKRRLASQIDLIDVDIQSVRDPQLRCKLIAAKARLWELLYPKPGSLRPKQSRTESRAPIQPIAPVSPASIVPPQAPETTDKPQAVVPSETSENHNAQ